MFFLIALLPLPEHYICAILCILCAYMVKPKHLSTLIVAACMACVHWYKNPSPMLMLPLQVITCILCFNLKKV